MTYTNERVIGHHIEATFEESVTRQLFEDLDIEPMYDGWVRITEGDVDWDESRSVRLSRKELQEIAEVFAE